MGVGIDLEPIFENDRQLIHYYIPVLSVSPFFCKVSDIEEENFHDGIVVRKYFSATGIFSKGTV